MHATRERQRTPGGGVHGKSEYRGQYGCMKSIGVFPLCFAMAKGLESPRAFPLWITCGHVDKAVDNVCITLGISLWISFFIM